ncbi:transposase family protein [Verrucosispora sp. WMMA2044]|uniref:transposase family protein n=1 Tax=Micromonospora TaxID=1873 RepID=UPI00248B1AA1|nr:MULTISPECIES: transposase family protein [Micromonospora]WBB50248.1 transposase family protein [Verrucosispora sp. WMMA2044]
MRRLEALARVPDPRDPRGVRYQLASVLAVAVCAVTAGASTFAAIGDWANDLDAPAWRQRRDEHRLATRRANRRPHDLITTVNSSYPTMQ